MTVKGLDGGRRSALVISECQNGIINPAYTQSPLSAQVVERDIVSRLIALSQHFRAAGLPVIHCTIAAPVDFIGWNVNCVLAAWIAREGKLMDGTPFAAIHDELVLEPHDIVVARNHGMSPFTGTSLDATLRRHGVQTVVLAGVSTNIALPGAATEAVALGYDVVLAEDCTAGGTAESHRMQVSLHLPLISTISDSASIAAAIGQAQGTHA